MSAPSLEVAARLVVELTNELTNELTTADTFSFDAETTTAIEAAVTSAAVAATVDPDELWDHLAYHFDYRAGICAAFSGPARNLAHLINNKTMRVRTAVVHNPACPAQILHDVIVATPRVALWSEIAAHPNTASPTLERIAEFADHPNSALTVAERVALWAAVEAHPRCPEQLRDALARA